MFDYDKFRECLKMYRMQSGLSQERLSELIQITPRSISDIERGLQQPTLKTVIKLLNTFNLDYSSFISENQIDGHTLLIRKINQSLCKLSEVDKKYVLALSESINMLYMENGGE